MTTDSTVGRLRVELTADGRGLAEGLNIAGKELKRTERTASVAASSIERRVAGMSASVRKSVASASFAVGGLGEGISGALGGLASSVALGGVLSLSGALTKAVASIEQFDRLAKQARSSGLDSDFFQSLSFAAVEASVDQEKLNAALAKFNLGAGLAASGTGELVEKLRRVSPELLKSIQAAKSNADRLRLLADAARDAGSASARAALLSAAFGESAGELGRIFGNGSDALDDFARRARDLGLIVPRELLDRSEDLANQLGVLSRVIDTNVSASLVSLGPLIVAVLDDFRGLTDQIRQLNEAFADPSFRKVAEAAGFRFEEGGAGDRLLRYFEDRKAAVADLSAALAEARSRLADLEAIAGSRIAGPLDEAAVERQLALVRELAAELARARVASTPAGTSPTASLTPPPTAPGGDESAYRGLLESLRAASAEQARRAALSERQLAVEDAVAEAMNRAAAAGVELTDARQRELRTLVEQLDFVKRLAAADKARTRQRVDTAYDVAGGSITVSRPAPTADRETIGVLKSIEAGGVEVVRSITAGAAETGAVRGRVEAGNGLLSGILEKVATAEEIGSAVARAMRSANNLPGFSGEGIFKFSGDVRPGGSNDTFFGQSTASLSTRPADAGAALTSGGAFTAPARVRETNDALYQMATADGGDTVQNVRATQVNVAMFSPLPSRTPELARATVRADLERVVRDAGNT